MFLLVGLGLGVVGDVLLAFRSISTTNNAKFFLGGLVAFLLGHVIYVLAFLRMTQMPGWTSLIAVVLAGGVFWLILRMGCQLGRMKLPVLSYVSVISVMVLSSMFAAKAGDTVFGVLVVTGAVLFLISDFVLCLLLFAEKRNLGTAC
jgi:uncharacterized membrane protein YhhN